MQQLPVKLVNAHKIRQAPDWHNLILGFYYMGGSSVGWRLIKCDKVEQANNGEWLVKGLDLSYDMDDDTQYKSYNVGKIRDGIVSILDI